MEAAMMLKQAEELSTIRLIRSDIIHFAGMGASKRYSDQEIMSIPIVDNRNIILPIKTVKEAVALLKSFY